MTQKEFVITCVPSLSLFLRTDGQTAWEKFAFEYAHPATLQMQIVSQSTMSSFLLSLL